MRKIFLVSLLMLMLAIPAFASVGILNSTGVLSGETTDIGGGENVNLTLNGSIATIALNTTLTGETLTSPTINTPTISGGTQNNTAITNGTINGATVGLTSAAAANFSNVAISGTLNVSGNTTFGNVSQAGGSANNTAITNGTANNVTITNGTINNATIGLTTAAAANFTNVYSGNESISGALNVTGNTTMNSMMFMPVGANKSAGTATLLNGTILVNTTMVTANSLILYSRQTNGTGATGNLFIPAKNAAANFTINSSAATDNSTVAWMLIN